MSDDDIQAMVTENRATPEQAEGYLEIKRMSDEKFEDALEEENPEGKRYTEPEYWTDTRFNNAAQPVVGVTWYEARAYCAWLSAQSGLAFRLPTEAEWEAACRGQDGWRYAYDNDFDVACANTFESHIRRTTPVGVFANGATPGGLMDMTGNTWDWTSSLFAKYPYANTPEHEDAESTAARVARGGSWDNDHGSARASSRYDVAIDRYSGVGFRLVCVRPLVL